jgi:Formin Homology 2 Domain
MNRNSLGGNSIQALSVKDRMKAFQSKTHETVSTISPLKKRPKLVNDTSPNRKDTVAHEWHDLQGLSPVLKCQSQELLSEQDSLKENSSHVNNISAVEETIFSLEDNRGQQKRDFTRVSVHLDGRSSISFLNHASIPNLRRKSLLGTSSKVSLPSFDLPSGKAAPPPPLIPKKPVESNVPFTQLKPIFTSGFIPSEKFGTLWARADAGKVFFQEAEIQREFPATKQPDIYSQILKVKQHAVSSLKVLDDRKGRNIEISFRMFKSPEGLHNILRKSSYGDLSEDDLTLLLREFPADDLISRMEKIELENPSGEWEAPEQYLLAMCTIPNCRDILSAWRFAVLWEPVVASHIRDLDRFSETCTTLVDSKCLLSLLRSLLTLGNRLNAGTHRADQAALTVDSFLFFEEHKTVSGQSTALEFVVSRWADHYPDYAKEMNTLILKISASVNSIKLFRELEQEVNVLLEDSERANACVTILENHGALSIKEAVLKGCRQVFCVKARLADSKYAWQNICEYFGLREHLVRNSKEFFELMNRFLKQVSRYLK